jgi:hypothetical protein
MTPATAVTSAMLRPQGYRQEEGERRNGHQTPHIGLLYARMARNPALRPGRILCTHLRRGAPSLRFLQLWGRRRQQRGFYRNVLVMGDLWLVGNEFGSTLALNALGQ